MELTGSQIVVECLKEQGVDTVFGYPGGTILNIYDELYRHQDEIRHILTSHEQGASHAADGYARATGKVGVCLATSGPGATNLVTGIATANMDSVPLVAITANVVLPMLGKDTFQEVDIAGVAMPITKHTFIVKDIKKLADTIRKAFAIARSGRPGAVLVDITKDVTANKCNYTYKSMEDSMKEYDYLTKKNTYTDKDIDKVIVWAISSDDDKVRVHAFIEPVFFIRYAKSPFSSVRISKEANIIVSSFLFSEYSFLPGVELDNSTAMRVIDIKMVAIASSIAGVPVDSHRKIQIVLTLGISVVNDPPELISVGIGHLLCSWPVSVDKIVILLFGIFFEFTHAVYIVYEHDDINLVTVISVFIGIFLPVFLADAFISQLFFSHSELPVNVYISSGENIGYYAFVYQRSKSIECLC